MRKVPRSVDVLAALLLQLERPDQPGFEESLLPRLCERRCIRIKEAALRDVDPVEYSASLIVVEVVGPEQDDAAHVIQRCEHPCNIACCGLLGETLLG